MPGSSPVILSPPSCTLQDRLIEYTFQIIGIAAAIIFGVWSIKSYSTSITANSLSSQSVDLATQANNIAQTSIQQTIYQNQLALLSFCVENTNVKFNETCLEVLEFMAPASASASATRMSGPGGLANIVSALGIPPVKTGPPFPGSDAAPPILELPFGALVGIIVTVVVMAGVIAVKFLKRTPNLHSPQRRRMDEEQGSIGRKA